MEKRGEKRSKSNFDQVKKSNFYLAIFNRIKEGKSPSNIAKDYKISKQKVHHYTNNLKKWGFIDKNKNGDWFVKVKEFSLGTRPHTNLHALQINIPILSGEIKGSDWEVKEELKNWTPKYKTLSVLGGLTIKNNNNKSVSLFAHERNVADIKDIDALCFDIRNWALEWFKQQYDVTLDLFRAEVKSLHIATQDNQAEGMNSKGERFELDLDKSAEKVFPADKIQAKAWIDPSPYPFTAETNDKDWKRAYLGMPFNIKQLLSATMYIAKNYESHVGVVEKLNKLLEVKEVKIHIKEIVKSGKQTKLGDFI